MKSKQRLAILIGAVIALMVILAVVPVFGATATLRFPDASDTTAAVSWARQGGTVMIEVTDADLDTGTAKVINITVDGQGFWLSGETLQINTIGNTGAAVGGVTVDAAVTAPILDQDASGSVTLSDVSETSTLIAIVAVDGGNGIITVQALATVTAGIIQLSYTSGAVNDTADGDTANLLGTVGVTSDASPASGIYILEESGSQTGVFRGVLSLVATDSATSTYECLKTTCARISGGTVPLGHRTTTKAEIAEGAFADGTWSVGDLGVSAADTVALIFVDTAAAGTAVNRTASIVVETTDPTVANTSPVSGTATDNNLPTIGGEITDTDSLVSSASIKVVFGYDFTATPNSTMDKEDVISVVANDIDAIDSGFAITQRVATIDAEQQNEDHVVYWWIIGNDIAGNNFVSDAATTDADGVANPCDADAFQTLATVDLLAGVDVSVSADVHGCQGFSISVDRTAPALASATTGVFWDTTLAGADKTQLSVTSSNATSISVIFDGALDSGSVDRTDFTVDGVTPLGVTTFAGAPTRVFLEVATQDAAARPVVAVVGTVTDLAGNDADSGSVTASDGIAPTLTLAVSSAATPAAARPVTNDKVSVTLTSDEKGTGVQIFVVKVGADTTTTGVETELTELGGPTSWTATADQTGDGIYSIRAKARDLNSTTNIGTAGLATSTEAITLASGVIFELDTTIPTPTIIPSTATGTDDPNTVISINFADEGKEYGLTTAGAATADSATVVTNFDTFSTVTVTKAELDGVDILASLSTSDNVRFLFKAANLAIGAHTLDVSATDSAGNAVVFLQHTFSVTVRASTSISLTPGWNMISFPGNPGDASIDAVIGTVPVTVIMAYDPTNAAQWLIASREDATQSFSGTLTTISSGLGYWVLTDTFESISTFIPRTAGGAAGGDTPVQPPTVKLVAGWNLVPVLDVTGNQTGTTNIDPATYFGSVATITRVYWFNTLDGSWVTVDHAGAGDHTAGDNDLTLRIGRSYWVFTTAAGTITP